MNQNETDFAVWAPGHRRVRVEVNGIEHEMTSAENGWWHWKADRDMSSADYAFLLEDEETALPDPRSAWQPHGVLGASRVYDHSAFDWTDQAWAGRALPGGVLYELHIGTFTPAGTFDSAIEKLDYLAELGISHVEVMPINSFDGQVGWGYDGVLWGAVHEPYGGPDGFKRFINACHERKLGVILDVVYNHLGPSGACLDHFGPYFAGHNNWGPGLNLDGPYSDEVRRYVLDNALSWLRDFHVDGLRLDAVHALTDQRAIPLLEELAHEVESLSAQLRRPLTLIAESDLNDPRLISARQAGGYGLTAQWSDDVHHALHVKLTGENTGYYSDFAVPDALARTLREAFFHAGTWSSFRQRTHGRPVDKEHIPGHRFVAYLQTHDQIGNRAAGDRLSATVSPGLLACGAAIIFCSPYTPMIFMGEEWAASTPWQFFVSFTDPKLAEGVRTGRRQEFGKFGWDESQVADPLSPDTVSRSQLKWSEITEPRHREILNLYRSLIALRREYPQLADPDLSLLTVDSAEDGSWLALNRGDLRLICNFSAEEVSVEISVTGTGQRTEVLLSWAEATITEARIQLPPESFVLLKTTGG
jgi:maltooligosyltrehalose trehalohydrolase